ncbi:hypothetical protein G9A89_012007 [Geosiphon pyriformis]|nr:hypothetical protein G9A89_012007 [Geosiphon pyriformis]
MAYAPIAKLDNFMGKKDDAQIWLNDIEKAIVANGWNDTRAMQAIPYFLKDTADSWYQSLINKPQDFNAFKAEFLRYFSNNNSINCLVNAFTTMKQGETEAVTTYLRHFHRNLCQIQAIDANYFTAPQILNQFIHGLRSSILQHVCPLHPGTLQDAVTHARDFESAESEANHVQAVNLVMNGSSELDSKLENLHNDAIIKETLIVPKINHVYLHQPIDSGNKKCISATIVVNKDISKLTVISSQDQYQNNYLPMTQQTIYQPPVYQPPIHQPQPQVIYQPQPQIIYQPQLIQTPTQNSAQMTAGNLQSRHVPTNTISPATISSDKSLAAIFPFELEENTLILLFSEAALEEKPITAMYMDARVDSHPIKLILDSGSAGSIITRQLMDQLGHRVD